MGAASNAALEGPLVLEQPTFGRRLRELRLARGLSQAEVAEGGLSTAYLSRLESGARPPTAKVLEHLVERLGVQPSTFQTVELSPLGEVLARATSADDQGTTALPLLDAAVRESGDKDVDLRWVSLWKLTQLHARQGRLPEALAAARTLAALSDQIGVPLLRERVHTHLAWCLRESGEIAEALVSAQAAVAIAEEHAIPQPDTVKARLVLISVLAESNRLVEAHAEADKLLAVTEELNGLALAEVLWSIANVHIREADPVGAAELLDRALRHLDSRESPLLWMRLRMAAASLNLQMNPPRVESAERLLNEAEAVVKIIGTPVHEIELDVIKAHLAFQQGDLGAARELYERVAPSMPQLSYRDRVRVELLHNQILILEGETQTGVRHIEELASKAQEHGNAHLVSEIWRVLATTLSGPAQAKRPPAPPSR
ncbi:helix-turn-helix domain-containing protein [Streptomyces olivaceoviridis]|uniref:helix-turn-helix domain-containing protein n=1 Tax=Streptomyces olivaceoviridis TaxID=1921 RepID=UPI0036F8172F